MDWTQAMVGATAAILKMHAKGKCPSVKQRAIRLAVTRIAVGHHLHIPGMVADSKICDPRWLRSPKLILEYKRKD